MKNWQAKNQEKSRKKSWKKKNAPTNKIRLATNQICAYDSIPYSKLVYLP
jgi:hypothetical protein